MKKLFSLLSALTITGTSIPSLVSCKIFDTNNEASYKQSTIIKQKMNY
ncbi:lipoprotein [Spiroplasma endosymbiont of Glossina fuscipes fuscipes]